MSIANRRGNAANRALRCDNRNTFGLIFAPKGPAEPATDYLPAVLQQAVADLGWDFVKRMLARNIRDAATMRRIHESTQKILQFRAASSLAAESAPDAGIGHSMRTPVDSPAV